MRTSTISFLSVLGVLVCGTVHTSESGSGESLGTLGDALLAAHSEVEWVDVRYVRESFTEVNVAAEGIPSDAVPVYRGAARWVCHNAEIPSEWRVETYESNTLGVVDENEETMVHVDGVTYYQMVTGKNSGRESRRLSIGSAYNSTWTWTASNPYAILTPLARRPKTLIDYLMSAVDDPALAAGLAKVRVREITQSPDEGYWELVVDRQTGAIHQADHILIRGEDTLLLNRYLVTQWSDVQADGNRWPMEVLHVNRPTLAEGTSGRTRIRVTELRINEPLAEGELEIRVEPHTRVENQITGESYIVQ